MIVQTSGPKYFQALYNPINITVHKDDYQVGDLFYLDLYATNYKNIRSVQANNPATGSYLQTLVQNGDASGNCTFEIGELLQSQLPFHPFVPNTLALVQSDTSNYIGYYYTFGILYYDEQGNEVKVPQWTSYVNWAFRGAFDLDESVNWDDWYAKFSNYAKFLTFQPEGREVAQDEPNLLGLIVPANEGDTAATTKRLVLKANLHYLDGTVESEKAIGNTILTEGRCFYFNAKPELLQPNVVKRQKLFRANVWVEYESEVAKAWRGFAPSCVISSNGFQTGYVNFTQLEEYYTGNNQATGTYKANAEGDPNYISGSLNEELCPRPISFNIYDPLLGQFTIADVQGGQPSLSYEYRVDGGAWAALSQGYHVVGGMAGGDHTVEVRKGSLSATRTVRTPWGNQDQTSTYNRNNCGSGYNGGDVTYTVPPNKYISYVSQQDANNQAYAELVANGQNHANTYGTCTVIPPAIKRTITIGISQTNYSPDFASYVTVTYQSNGVAAVGYVEEGGNSFQVDDGTQFTLEPSTSGNYSGNGFIGYRNIYNQIITPPFYAVSDYAITCLFDMRVANTPGGGDGTTV